VTLRNPLTKGLDVLQDVDAVGSVLDCRLGHQLVGEGGRPPQGADAPDEGEPGGPGADVGARDGGLGVDGAGEGGLQGGQRRRGGHRGEQGGQRCRD
jgi:hypothetical protein